MTTKEAFEKYKQVSQDIVDFDNKSDSLTEAQYGKVIDTLIKIQDDAVIQLVSSCGRKVFDSCQRRMTDCGNCVGHLLFKHRQNWKN